MSTANQVIAYETLAMKIGDLIVGVADVLEFGGKAGIKIPNLSKETNALYRALKIKDDNSDGNIILEVKKGLLSASLETNTLVVRVDSYEDAKVTLHERNWYAGKSIETQYTPEGKQITKPDKSPEPLVPFTKDESDMIVNKILKNMEESTPLRYKKLIKSITKPLIERDLWKNKEYRDVNVLFTRK